jgi:uncharacterized membrane protein YhiD involved in acid resistance
VLGAGLARRTGTSLWPAALGRVVAVSAAVGVGAWAVSGAVLGDDPGRLADLAVVAGLGLVGAGVVLAGYLVLGVREALTTRQSVPRSEAVAAEGLA